MWLKWLPWRFIVRSLARRHGFVDPLSLLTKLHRFGEPAEVAAPIELLRAGAVFHARGLMNTNAIQHNLDWVWPFWVERQFNPHDEAFIPRAFSVTHVNLTHRNWTAVGLPDVDLYPIVDPRGLLTPHWDGWSIDAWILADDGTRLLPSRTGEVRQSLEMQGCLAVVTEVEQQSLHLVSRTQVIASGDGPSCHTLYRGRSDRPGWLVLSLRPYNPEGVSFVYHLESTREPPGWTVDKSHLWFSQPPDRRMVSDYRRGDVFLHLPAGAEQTAVDCRVGMATAAALYRLEPDRPREVELTVPLTRPAMLLTRKTPSVTTTRPPTVVAGERTTSWNEALGGSTQLVVADSRIQMLYDAAIRMLALHVPGDVFAGPYTYKRFWVRDSALILHALLCAGLGGRVARALPTLLGSQRHSGYFHSQEGEWDANGEALWILFRYCLLSGAEPPHQWRRALLRGGRWIVNKRLPREGDMAHAGLLPPGFSAEHLGPNDYYYWDDFWSIGGLRGAAVLLDRLDETPTARRFRREADDLLDAVNRSLELTAARRPRPGIPASPYRRMDAGAIGSLAGGYPLQVLREDDPRLLDTASFLRDNCFVDGGFFQDMIHSGINAYLTLHVAQVLLRAGDGRWFEPVEAVARLASPTGQWPEAVHPRTGGGCMGDGQHMWAAAEWVMAIRNAFVRDEPGRLVLVSGIPQEWLDPGTRLSFGPAPTPWGDVTVDVEAGAERIVVKWQGDWRTAIPTLEMRLPGNKTVQESGERGAVSFPATTLRKP